MRVFDLFSGVGGYTCGALQAFSEANGDGDRCEITAVDCEMPVLAALGANVRAHAPLPKGDAGDSGEPSGGVSGDATEGLGRSGDVGGMPVLRRPGARRACLGTA